MIPIIAAVLIILLTGLNFAYATTAKVIKVYDGDTLKVDVQGEIGRASCRERVFITV